MNANRTSVEGVDRSRLVGIQRARILGAMVNEVSERGAANVSVAHVVARSGVSRRTFYEIFEDREDCFLAAFDEALAGIAGVVVPAFERSGDWRAKTRAALIALLEYLDHDPASGRLLIVESLAAGPSALARRRRVQRQIVSELERAISEAKNGGEGKGGNAAPALSAEGVLGGVSSILHARLIDCAPSASPETDGDALSQPSFRELVGPLMGMIVLPYLGQAAARREVERPVPERDPVRPLRRNDPLQDLEIRLTYRTVRILRAVARDPGSSNRALADAAEIGDQGQASKLLKRLQRVGLVENRGVGAATRGESNAWWLTPKGREVQDSIAGVPA